MEPQQENNEQHGTPAAKKAAISLPAAIVTAAAIIGIAIIFAFGSNGSPAAPRGADNKQPTSVASDVAALRSGEYLRGNNAAEVVIIEYSDSDCPFCAQFHGTMQEVLKAYDGDVAWAYRFFPLTSIHPNAYAEAIALACVGELGGNEKFWDYLDTVMNVTFTADAKSSETLSALATGMGIDASLFQTCLASQSSKAAVDAGIEEAKRIGARGTPFSIALNRKTGKQVVIPGAVPLENLTQTIDGLLK